MATSRGSAGRARARRQSSRQDDDTIADPAESSSFRADDDTSQRESDTMLPAVSPIPKAYTSAPLLRYDNIPNELAEALRSIINRYELRGGEPLPKSIAVTSSLPGEGVTTVSQALSTMIAQEMKEFVCWVDCGWLKPNSDANVDNGRPDLLSILADQSRVLSAFHTSPDLPNLMSLAPGPVPESKRNLIVRSPEFERLLGILADEFDHVVFDLPPVLTSANGLALLRQADVSLMVVRHRSTSIVQVQRALQATQPTPNLGVVLNQYRTSIPAIIRPLLGA